MRSIRREARQGVSALQLAERLVEAHRLLLADDSNDTDNEDSMMKMTTKGTIAPMMVVTMMEATTIKPIAWRITKMFLIIWLLKPEASGVSTIG